MSFSPENAETLALQALSWLAAHDELMPVFLGSTGAGLENMKAQAMDPAFLGSVLDFITMNDAWVIEFCDTLNLDYTAPMIARQSLPGGEHLHFT